MIWTKPPWLCSMLIFRGVQDFFPGGRKAICPFSKKHPLLQADYMTPNPNFRQYKGNQLKFTIHQLHQLWFPPKWVPCHTSSTKNRNQLCHFFLLRVFFGYAPTHPGCQWKSYNNPGGDERLHPGWGVGWRFHRTAIFKVGFLFGRRALCCVGFLKIAQPWPPKENTIDTKWLSPPLVTFISA